MSEKVLFLSYNGLLEPILASQGIPYMEALAKRGFEFFLLTYEKKSDLQKTGREKVEALRAELKAKGIDWHYLRYHKAPRVLATAFDLCVGAIYSLCIILREKINIVHVRGITPGTIMLMIPGLVRTKVLFDMRGRLAEEMAAGGRWKEEGAVYNLVKAAEKALLLKADAITVLTRQHLEYLKKLDYLKGRPVPMEIIPCAVDIDHFGLTENDGGLKEKMDLSRKFVILYPGKTGTFYLMKEMFDFYRKLRKYVPGSIFLILTNDDRKIVLEEASDAGLAAEDVKVINGIGFDEMPRYLKMADAGIFFINAYNKLGSSPIKLGEFLAAGVPVIINPGVGDTEELVRGNRVGVVVGSFTEAGYEDAVKALLSLKKEGDLERRCTETARRYLSLEDAVKKYSDIYETLSGTKQ